MNLLVVAGEASGDAHGARVIERLRARAPQLAPFGLGGERLAEQGLESVGDGAVLGVIGFGQVVRALGRIRRLFAAVLQAVRQRQPRAALLIDLPGFNLRLAKLLRREGVSVVYYIAPQAWAWRRGRVRKLRRRVDRLCAVFPFEESFFAAAGVPVEFVGHPLTELPPSVRPAEPDRVALVPGSRRREIERLLPALAGAARLLAGSHPGLRFELPLAPGVERARVEELLARAGLEARLVPGGAGAALAGARLALCTSGTATLEAALCGVPPVVVYRLSRLDYALVRPFYRLPAFCILNILAGRPVVPELLQAQVTPEGIAQRAEELLADGPVREQALADLRQVASALGRGAPSERVAAILAGYLGLTGEG